jgi:predicted O-linked N-acetylglucosamine transferase (SPINDLY family)
MAAVPDAHLLLKTGSAVDSVAHQGLIAELVGRGVARERIEVRGPMDQLKHLATYGEIDVLLDTFPHCGGVTTLESMLMGVPTVTLIGERVAGRLSASFLTALGLEDLIAKTADEYVEIAADVAARPTWLAELRVTLRDRLLTSPVGDVRAYTQAVETTYRQLWQRWCEQSEEQAALSPVR